MLLHPSVEAPVSVGVVSRPQALASGMTPSQLGHLVRSGRWQRVHPGVYATFSGPLPRASLIWAALLHCGAGAMLSHRTAAAEQGLLDDEPELIDVMVAADHRVSRRAGIVLHRSRRSATARHPARSLPQTRVEETVLDLVHDSATVDDVVGWLTRACQRRLTTAAKLRAVASSRSRLRHRRLVRDVLGDIESGVASPLELRYAQDVERRHGLPPARRGLAVLVRGRRRYRDVAYEEYSVQVELEGLAWHPDDRAHADDLRDNEAVLVGAVVLRYGWAPVAGKPCEVAAEVADVLRRCGWRGQPRACGPDCAVTQTFITRSWQRESAG